MPIKLTPAREDEIHQALNLEHDKRDEAAKKIVERMRVTRGHDLREALDWYLKERSALSVHPDELLELIKPQLRAVLHEMAEAPSTLVEHMRRLGMDVSHFDS